MQTKSFDKPWPHIEYSNFFIDFEQVKAYAYEKLDTEKDSSLFLTTNSNDPMYKTLKPLLIQRFKEITKLLDLQVKGRYVPVLSFASVNGGDTNGIHIDASWKFLSMLVYLSETGNGTRLYKVYEKDVQRVIRWKENGGVAFANGPNNWHEAGVNSDKGPRIIANIMFGRIEKIQEIYPDAVFDDK